MTTRSRHAFAVLAVSAALSSGAGCAKDATSVALHVEADASAPPLLILRTTVTRADDPARAATSMRSSPYASDAGDRPGPFAFPLDLDLTMDPGLAGPVDIRVEGLDWDTTAVIASGSTTAAVVAEKPVSASVTLFGYIPAR